MKTLASFMAILLCGSLNVQAQMLTLEPDRSPMDMAYFPVAYPILKFQAKNVAPVPKARIIYSRPQKNGRELFGDIVPYNEVWRLGANESTELEFFQDVTIGGKKVVKGRYSIFCIPQAAKWTMILNKGLDTWGTFSYNKSLDVLRTDIGVQKSEQPFEYFTMAFDSTGALMVLWDKVKTVLPVKYSK